MFGRLQPLRETTDDGGVVFDDDRDGVPDRRVGKDNTAETMAGWNANRVWITDLHTGRTVVQEGDRVGEVYVGAYFHGRFSFGHDTPSEGMKGTSLVNRPLYLWASVIQDGRVVATDYAPDVGWLDTSLETTQRAVGAAKVQPLVRTRR